MRLHARASLCGFPTDNDWNFTRSDCPAGKSLHDRATRVVITKIHNTKTHETAAVKSPDTLGVPGMYGAVMQTKEGVVKFDRSSTEALLLARLPSYLKKHPIIPQNVKTGSVRLPLTWGRCDGKKYGKVKLSTISRENLENIPHFSPVLIRLGGLYGSMSCCISDDYQTIPAKVLRDKLKLKLVEWHKACQSAYDLDPKEKKVLKTFAGGMARLLRFGIIPRDLHNGNFGIRADGTVAIRDLGIYIVLNDKIKKSPNPRVVKGKGIMEAVKRLISTRTPPPIPRVCSYILSHRQR